jgi:hypothetical protein
MEVPLKNLTQIAFEELAGRTESNAACVFAVRRGAD